MSVIPESLRGPPIGNFTALVNGKLTGCEPIPQRSFYRTMDLKRILGRIERRLIALGISADEASKKSGLSRDAIRNMRRAVRGEIPMTGVSMATLTALAPTLRTTVAWLSEEAGPEDTEDDIGTIPVWGKAGAGEKVYQFHEGGQPIDRIPAPAGSNSNTGAVQIDGDSLGRLFNKWYAIYDERRDPPTVDLIGRVCVVQLKDGRVYIKRLKKGRGNRFTLESNVEAPIENVAVEWAARVKDIVQP